MKPGPQKNHHVETSPGRITALTASADFMAELKNVTGYPINSGMGLNCSSTR